MHTYEELKTWLNDDLGRISNLEELALHSQQFLDHIKAYEIQDQAFSQSVLLPVQSMLSMINDSTLNDEVKKERANQLLKNIFMNVFFAEEYYDQRIHALRSESNYEAEVVSRLKSSNPLPTLDGIFTLRDDPRQLSQTERAASLVSAAVNIFIQLKKEKKLLSGKALLTWKEHSHYFGKTVITSYTGNVLHIPLSSPTHITVLINGQAYYLAVLQNNSTALSTRDIQFSLDAMVDDFEKGNRHHALGSITAAPRDLCHKAREKLESRSKNASMLKLIDESLFILCLDREVSLLEDKASQMKRLFTNFSNRWYGTSQFVVGPDGESGIISSYSRGDNFSSFVPLIDKIVETAEAITMGRERSNVYEKLQPKKLHFEMEENELHHLDQAIAPYFHPHRSLFKLGIGLAFFVKRKLHPNAAIQMLIMLAARDIDPQKKLPIFKQALIVQDPESIGSTLDWVFIPTHKIRKFIDGIQSQKLSDAQLFALFKEAVDDHANRIKRTSEGWSPTYFLKKPEGKLYDALCEYFVKIGNKFEGAYASYLFRPARLPNCVDVLTSFHSLPKTITLLGRPGGTLEAVSKFGAHIAFSRHDIEFSWMPNVNSGINLEELDAALRKWVSYIEKISATGNKQDEKTDVPSIEDWATIIFNLTKKAKAGAPFMLGYPVSTNLEENQSANFLELTKYHWQQGPDPFLDLPIIPYAANARAIEKQVVEFMMSLYQGKNCWGYVASGGHESNRAALLTARNKYPNGLLYFSDQAHYGVNNLADELRMEHRIIASQKTGKMDVEDLMKSIDKTKPVIVVATLGSTMKGSIDDVRDIIKHLEEQHITNRYIHCDAALHGNYIPFMQETSYINFAELPIDSIAISPYKAWGSVTPNSVFLVNEPLYMKRSAEYVLAEANTTRYIPTSSRSSLSCLGAMDSFVRVGGKKGMAQETKRRMNLTRYAVDKLEKIGLKVFSNPNSTIICIENFPQNLKFIEYWQLKLENNMASIVVSGHFNEKLIDQFCEAIKTI